MGRLYGFKLGAEKLGNDGCWRGRSQGGLAEIAGTGGSAVFISRVLFIKKIKKKKKFGDKCVRFPIYLSPTYLRWLRKIATYRLNAKCELWFRFFIKWYFRKLSERTLPNSTPWKLPLNIKIQDSHSVSFLANKFLSKINSSGQNLIQVNNHLFITKTLLFFCSLSYTQSIFTELLNRTIKPITSFILLPNVHIDYLLNLWAPPNINIRVIIKIPAWSVFFH